MFYNLMGKLGKCSYNINIMGMERSNNVLNNVLVTKQER